MKFTIERDFGAASDLFTFKYTVWWLIVFSPLFILIFLPGPLDVFIVFLCLVYAAADFLHIGWILLIFLSVVFAQLLKKCWRRAISIFIAPFICLAMWSLLYTSPIPNWVYLQVHKASYFAEIDKEKHAKKSPVFKVFHVSDWGFVASAQGSYTIIYDENDDMTEFSKTHLCSTVKKIEKNFYYVSSVYSGCMYGEKYELMPLLPPT